MNKFVITITLFLLLGLALSEIHMFILKFYPQTAIIERSFWLDKNHNEKISLVWYVYEVSNILNRMIWVFCFASVANLISHRLCNVIIVFFFYYLTQFLFYIWDRNTVLFSNFIVYLYMLIAIVFLQGKRLRQQQQT